MRDGAAFVAFLDAQPQTNKKAKVGVQGYCMGGPLTVLHRRGGSRPGRRGGHLPRRRRWPPPPRTARTSWRRKIKASLLIAVADNDDMREPDGQGHAEEGARRRQAAQHGGGL